ncbi:MAG: hypothetical protein HYY01_02245 [Chloroflexi bacterium]|nr:hypothetical protein [Chloroflexota bacterium]
MATPPQMPLEQDPHGEVWREWPGAVLLYDDIKYYCTEVTPKLIDPFRKENLKPARYQLTLGPEARIDGKTICIDDNHPLIIPAHQVAIVRTSEVLNIPRFLIGRWNLKVDMVYKGLLWVGGQQVDPGWTGYLPCPLYNLSRRDIRIAFGEQLFTIDFVRTTRFVRKGTEEGRSEARVYPVPPKKGYNPPLGKYDDWELKSGPYEVFARLDAVEEDQATLAQRSSAQTNTIFTMLAVIIAALAVFFGAAMLANTEPMRRLLPDLGSVATFLAALALAISVITLIWSKPFRRRNQGDGSGRSKPI